MRCRIERGQFLRRLLLVLPRDLGLGLRPRTRRTLAPRPASRIVRDPPVGLLAGSPRRPARSRPIGRPGVGRQFIQGEQIGVRAHRRTLRDPGCEFGGAVPS